MLSAEELKCAICVTVISSRANLTTHMVLKHAEGEKSNYNCSSCDKGFIRLCDLNNHKQGHKGSLRNLNKQFKCKICSRSFVSIKNFERHQEIHKEKPFVCQSCGFRTYSNGSLKSHAKIHMQDFSYACSICDKKFRHRNSQVVHIRGHTGDKPYKCSTCNKMFSQATHLLNHKRSMHSESSTPNEQCKVCKKAFKSREYVRQHAALMHNMMVKGERVCSPLYLGLR